MRLGLIVARLKDCETTFGNNIGGAAELGIAVKETYKTDMAFVIPLTDTANTNPNDFGINQKITEKFGIVVALNNDASQADKIGFKAYDRLHSIRAEIWSAILGWQMTDMEDVITYVGGRLININRAYLWYQFEFKTAFRIDDDDGVPIGDLDNFDTLYGQWILTPSANVPIESHLPIDSDVTHMETSLDFTVNPDIDGGFSNGFHIGFKTYKG